MTAACVIDRITALDLRYEAWDWPFARDNRAEIAAHFARARETKPAMWNGRVLLARTPKVANARLTAPYFETDFASFLTWRDRGFPDTEVVNGFGMGALRTTDNAFLLGEMAAQTANAGRIYFASGTPDPSDRFGDIVDIAASVAREVAEETGLSPADYDAAPEWTCVRAGQLLAMIRVLHLPIDACAAQTRIAAFLASEREPELVRMHVVRGASDLSDTMPDFVHAFLRAQFG